MTPYETAIEILLSASRGETRLDVCDDSTFSDRDPRLGWAVVPYEAQTGPWKGWRIAAFFDGPSEEDFDYLEAGFGPTAGEPDIF